MKTEELYIWRYGIDFLKDYWSMANLMFVISMMKVKGRSFRISGNGCGKIMTDGARIYLPSYTLYATRNRESCNLIFLTKAV